MTLNGFPPQQLWVKWNRIQYYFHQAELWNYQLCKTKRTLCIFTNQLCSTVTNDMHNVGIHQNPAMYSWARTAGWHGSEPDSWQDIGKISQLSLAAWQRRGGGARHNRKGNCNMWNCGRCVSIYILMRIRLETIVSGCNEKVISKAISVHTDVSGNFFIT